MIAHLIMLLSICFASQAQSNFINNAAGSIPRVVLYNASDNFSNNIDDDFFNDDTNEVYTEEIYNDPMEKFNRSSFEIMTALNNAVTLPLASVYDALVPSFLHSHIYSAVQNNVQEPLNILSGMLIPHKPNMFNSISRLFFNTTFGLFGFFDVHSQYVEPVPNTRLHDIMQYYADHTLPYLVLPINFGNIFTIYDLFLTIPFYNVLMYEAELNMETIFAISLADLVVSVHQNKDEVDDVLNNSLDPYSIMRNIYYQLQKARVKKLAEPVTHVKYMDLIPEEFL